MTKRKLHNNVYFRDLMAYVIDFTEYSDRRLVYVEWYNRSDKDNVWPIGVKQVIEIPKERYKDWSEHEGF